VYSELDPARVAQVGVRSKVWVHKIPRIWTNPKNAVRELFKQLST